MKAHSERHRHQHIGWLRAAVLGANDGIVSTASLMIGVAASHADSHQILVSGTAGLVAGAMAMAAGEFVSVSSQVDTEQADLKREQGELAENHAYEVDELASIYENRGVDRTLAKQVAQQLMAHDALAVHARDELGLTEITRARPLQAAVTSALMFSTGAALPLLAVMLVPYVNLGRFDEVAMARFGVHGAPEITFVGLISLIALMTLGGIAAYAGRSPILRAVGRVSFWGMLSMAITAAVGYVFGASGL